MNEVVVLAEHRLGKLRDVTFEALVKGEELSSKLNAHLAVMLIGNNIENLAEELTYYVDEVLIYDDPRVKDFHSEYYRQIMSHVLSCRKSAIVLIPHTSHGIELAPSLAVELNAPIITDVLDVSYENGKLVVIREYFGGKLKAKIILRSSQHYVVTIRAGTSKPKKRENKGRIEKIENISLIDVKYKQVIKLVEPSPEAIDISSADIIVAVGRGIGDVKNLSLIEELAKLLGGVIACSRPVIDMRWLPKERLVGLSGKIVKPRLYLAIGISGQFYHVYGMSDSELIIAINKDPNAPIFNVADYGIVGDFLEVVPRLINKLKTVIGG